MICASISTIIAILCLVSLVLFGFMFSNKIPNEVNSVINQEIIKNLTSEISDLKKEVYGLRKSNVDLVAKDDHAAAKMERHSKMISAFKDKYENIETKVKVLEEHHENYDALVTTEVPNVQDVINGSTRIFTNQQTVLQVAIGLVLLTLIF